MAAINYSTAEIIALLNWVNAMGYTAEEINTHISQVGLYAKLASPTFTGSPKAPTVSNAATSNTQIATTAFVQAAVTAKVNEAIGNITTILASVVGG